MPLGEVTELGQSNCIKTMLGAFQRNAAVKAIIFMPGCTDEFNFFHRAHAKLTNPSPTMLDAVVALTNQTLIRATVRPPFLLLHTAEDPLEPLGIIQDEATANRIRKKKFDKEVRYFDKDWDFLLPILRFDLDTKMLPAGHVHASNHFFRHSFAAYDLTAYEALEAISMAGKTTFTIQKRKVLFEGDKRFLGKPPTPPNFLLPDGKVPQ